MGADMVRDEGQIDSRGRLLVVDDEAEVLAATQALLEARGWIVDTAGGVREAIARLNQRRDYSAVLVDYLLTDGWGTDLLSHMAQHQIRIPSVICSGLDQHPEIPSHIPSPHFLRKPYRLHDLESALSWAMDDR